MLRTIKIFFYSLLIVLLGCATQRANQDLFTGQKNNPALVHVYAMRGLLDIFSLGINSLVQTLELNYPVSGTALSYRQEQKLSEQIIEEHKKSKNKQHIVLIGHSFGADEQVTLARRLKKANIPVDLLITLDNTREHVIPDNVKAYYNINSGHSLMSAIIPYGKELY